AGSSNAPSPGSTTAADSSYAPTDATTSTKPSSPSPAASSAGDDWKPHSVRTSKSSNGNEGLCRLDALDEHAAASSVAPIAQLSPLPASLHRTRPARPVNEAHSGSSSKRSSVDQAARRELGQHVVPDRRRERARAAAVGADPRERG